MTRYRLTSDAERDLDTIKDYLLQQGGVRLVRHVVARIHRALNFLAEQPEAGHRREDLTAAPVKFWTVFSYMIIYDPAARPVTIVRVLHGSRDISTLLRH
jgi:plasmid stabilization system protein ParE